MRTLLFWFVLLSCNVAKTQRQTEEQILAELIPLAKSLMIESGFPIRVNTHMDGKLVIIVDSSEIGFNSFFSPQRGMFNNNPLETFYPFPRIRITPSMYNVLLRLKDTTDDVYFKARSILIHELGHYFQSNDGNDANYKKPNGNWHEYVSQPYEYPGYVIAAVYFMRNRRRTKYDEIMKLSASKEIKQQKLINAMMEAMYQDGRKPFAL